MELEESGSGSKKKKKKQQQPRNTDRKNSTENPKICPCTYSQLLYVKEAKVYNGEKTISPVSGAGKTGQLQAREWKQKIYLYHWQKIDSKWVKYLNVRLNTIKLLQENIGRTFFDINHNKIFFDPPCRAMKIKAKINKWDLLNLTVPAQQRKPPTKDNSHNGRNYLQMMQLTKD